MSNLAETSQYDLLLAAYREFNARQIDSVLARLHPDVEWANGMEGGHVHGREAVCAYWTRQWAALDPKVDPLEIRPGENGSVVVRVHQVVHDMLGKLLIDTIVFHVYQFGDGLIARMDIEKRSDDSEHHSTGRGQEK